MRVLPSKAIRFDEYMSVAPTKCLEKGVSYDVVIGHSAANRTIGMGPGITGMAQAAIRREELE